MRDVCPVCKGQNKTVMKRINLTIPQYFHLPGEYNVVVCEDCGFCFAETEATLEDYEYYYNHCNSYSGTPNESQDKTRFNQEMVKIIANLAEKDSVFLDVGFGRGNLMRLLRKKGFCNVCGIDPALDSVTEMKKEGFTVYRGSIFEGVKSELQGKYDFVFLFDVLEHLLYPDIAIENISNYLNENGCLIIGVPNYASLFDDDSILVNQFNQEHINYFSPISLDNLLKSKNYYRVRDESIECNINEHGVLGVYRRYKSNTRRNINILKDDVCKKSIADYINRNEKLEQLVDEKLEYFNKKNEPIYVWGTGAYTMWLLSNTKLKNYNIEAYIDNNCTKIGKEFGGRPIICAEKVCSNIPIVICCMRHSEEIVNQIKASHMLNDYIVV